MYVFSVQATQVFDVTHQPKLGPGHLSTSEVTPSYHVPRVYDKGKRKIELTLSSQLTYPNIISQAKKFLERLLGLSA